MFSVKNVPLCWYLRSKTLNRSRERSSVSNDTERQLFFFVKNSFIVDGSVTNSCDKYPVSLFAEIPSESAIPKVTTVLTKIDEDQNRRTKTSHDDTLFTDIFLLSRISFMQNSAIGRIIKANVMKKYLKKNVAHDSTNTRTSVEAGEYSRYVIAEYVSRAEIKK